MRIGATISGIELKLLNSIAESTAAANENAIRIATGQRVRSPSDDPATFVKIVKLEGRISKVQSAASRVDAASANAAQTQLTLDSIQTQLTAIRTALLTDEDQSLSSSQRDAKQAEIDTAIELINSLAATEIGGRSRLDGSTNFTISGKRDHQIQRLEVYSVEENEIFGTVTTRAQRGTITYTGASGNIQSNASFTLTGKQGSTAVTVTSGETLVAAAARINLDSHDTGVVAEVSNDTLTFRTVDYGENATIAVAVSSGTFAVAGGNGDGTAQGIDAIARLNGATLTGDGNTFNYNQAGLAFRLEFAGGFEGQFATVGVTDDGVDRYSLSTDLTRIDKLGLPGLQAPRLGGLSGSLDQLLTAGDLSGLATNTSQAIRVIDEAIGQVTRIQGRVDGFADAAIDSASSLLSGFEDALETALDAVNKADETEEAALLSQNNALIDNAISSLSILSQQRSSMVDLLRALAGF
jgi:flagellin-like hook-associated protein FlgL